MESNHHRITTMGQGSNLVAYHYALSSNLYFLLYHTFQSVVKKNFRPFLKIIYLYLVSLPFPALSALKVGVRA